MPRLLESRGMGPEIPIDEYGDDTARKTVISRRSSGYLNPGTLVAAAAGAVLLIFGLIAIIRSDIVGSLQDPVVDVAGFEHTPLLGLIEIGAGLLLLAAALAGSLALTRLVGAVLVVGAVVALVEPNALGDELTLENGYLWLVLALGAATLLVSLLLPSIGTRSTTTARQQRAIRS